MPIELFKLLTDGLLFLGELLDDCLVINATRMHTDFSITTYFLGRHEKSTIIDAKLVLNIIFTNTKLLGNSVYATSVYLRQY